MADVISVDYFRLANLAKSIGDVANSLGHQNLADVNLDSSPIVRDAYSDFLDEWKKTRNARIQALKALEDYLNGVVECFSQAECQLSDGLLSDS
jgi:hypothetical protein